MTKIHLESKRKIIRYFEDSAEMWDNFNKEVSCLHLEFTQTADEDIEKITFAFPLVSKKEEV